MLKIIDTIELEKCELIYDKVYKQYVIKDEEGNYFRHFIAYDGNENEHKVIIC